ncbi:MAG TPA: PQQ-binding-like beta-propeller repeat protein, partial [Pirellulales bacterium]
SFSAKGRIDGSPVIVGDRAYIGSDDGRLYGLSVATGEKVWEYEAGGKFASSPAVVDGRLVIGNDDGKLYCFGAR